ncbi:unnamed protein product [Sphagnum balticum]
MLLDHRDVTMIVFALLTIALVFGVVRSNLHMTLFGVVRNPQEVLATLNASHDEVSSSSAAAAPAPAGRSSSSVSVFDNNVIEPRSSRTDSQAFNISGCRREPVVAPLKNNPSEGLDHHHHVFQYMSATYNNMTDDELLWMATPISVRSRGAPPKQHTPGRIAFMFLIRGPLPFARLWERYFFGHEKLYSVYVHAHPSYVPDDVPLSSPFYGRFIRSQEVRWARISMYNAERRLLGNALLDYSNEWFVLLSEACIPLDNFRNTYEYITSSRLNFVQSYLDGDDSSAAALVVREGSSGRRRRRRRGGGGGGGGSRLSREHEQEMGPEITRQNFRKGSQWFQINRELAMLLAADTKLYDKFALSFCNPSSRACYMDEHYLPTVAALWLPEKLAYRTLTYFHFRGHAAHPNHWDKTRVNKSLIQWLRRGGDGHNYTTSIDINGLQPSQNKSSSVCYFFARKFDADALEPLLDIATEVMGIQALD